MKELDDFTNTVIDLIDFNESILNTHTYEQLMDKRDKALELYDRYEETIGKFELNTDERQLLNVLLEVLVNLNCKVKRLLETRITNKLIKQQILQERKSQ